MYSVQKLNKQADNIQPWPTPFPIQNQTTLPASWETCMQVKKQQLEPDMEQQTGSKLGKESIMAVYFHPD